MTIKAQRWAQTAARTDVTERVFDAMGRGDELRRRRDVVSRVCDAVGVDPIPVLPAGVEHHTTHGFAGSWEAWDALTAAGGWLERQWPTEWGFHQQKEGVVDECRVTVFPPVTPRRVAA